MRISLRYKFRILKRWTRNRDSSKIWEDSHPGKRFHSSSFSSSLTFDLEIEIDQIFRDFCFLCEILLTLPRIEGEEFQGRRLDEGQGFGEELGPILFVICT